jgi:mannose/fructose-specific phosphotransferase system component IIA
VIRGVIFTHRNLCHAFGDALEGMLGDQSDLVCLSNEGLAGDDLLPALREAVGENPEGTIVFTALYGGSCWQTAERLRHESTMVRHVTGTNLPMLLAFLNKRGNDDLDGLAGMLPDYGRRGIRP